MSAYYIDTSVLLGNIPCEKLVRNYIRDPSGIFHILTCEDIDDVVSGLKRLKMASERLSI